MSSKYKVGQVVELKTGKAVKVVSIRRSIHGNTSLIELQDEANGEVWRPVRTKWLTQAQK